MKLPVSGADKVYGQPDHWLRVLANKELFAVRRGVLKFRGFRPRKVPISTTALTDADFEPIFEQKGVDMRIGLDIALFAATHAVDRIILITNDTDIVPAMKYGRRAGLQLVLVALPGHKFTPELLPHTDFIGRLQTGRLKEKRARRQARPRHWLASDAMRRITVGIVLAKSAKRPEPVDNRTIEPHQALALLVGCILIADIAGKRRGNREAPRQSHRRRLAR